VFEVGRFLLRVNIFGETEDIDDGMTNPPPGFFQGTVMPQKDPANGVFQIGDCEITFPKLPCDPETIGDHGTGEARHAERAEGTQIIAEKLTDHRTNHDLLPSRHGVISCRVGEV